jgi:hypothetical protein
VVESHRSVVVPADEGPTALAEVDRGLVEAQFDAVLHPEPQGLDPRAGRVAAPLAVVGDRAEAQRQLAARRQLVGAPVVQPGAFGGVQPVVGGEGRRVVADAVRGDVAPGQVALVGYRVGALAGRPAGRACGGPWRDVDGDGVPGRRRGELVPDRTGAGADHQGQHVRVDPAQHHRQQLPVGDVGLVGVVDHDEARPAVERAQVVTHELGQPAGPSSSTRPGASGWNDAAPAPRADGRMPRMPPTGRSRSQWAAADVRGQPGPGACQASGVGSPARTRVRISAPSTTRGPGRLK